MIYFIKGKKIYHRTSVGTWQKWSKVYCMVFYHNTAISVIREFMTPVKQRADTVLWLRFLTYTTSSSDIILLIFLRTTTTSIMKLVIVFALLATTAAFTPAAQFGRTSALNQHVGAGGMADTRNPEPVAHEDPRKSISAAPSFEEYLKQRAGASAAPAAAAPAPAAGEITGTHAITLRDLATDFILSFCFSSCCRRTRCRCTCCCRRWIPIWRIRRQALGPSFQEGCLQQVGPQLSALHPQLQPFRDFQG